MNDVIVVGARVAGSATARLLAQCGHRVLVVDRASFPSDTVSTHCIDPVGMQLLLNWGLYDAVLATGTPRVGRFVLTVGGQELPADAPPTGVAAPRRTVLDKLLVDEARAAGAEVREGVKVTALLRDDDGRVAGVACVGPDGKPFEERARLVVGADGAHSFVAREVGAEHYDLRDDGRGSGYYSYYAGTGLENVELCFSPGYFAGVFPTNDGDVCMFAGQADVEYADRTEKSGNRDEAMVSTAAKVNERVAAAIAGGERTARLVKWRSEPGFFRKPYGPGWALVGDAGFHIDPVTGRGIGHAFRDADLLARAAHAALAGEPEGEAFARYQARRDEMSKPMFDLTQDIATLGWTNDELLGHFLNLAMTTQSLCDEVAAWGPVGDAAGAPGAAGPAGADGQVDSPTAAGAAATS